MAINCLSNICSSEVRLGSQSLQPFCRALSARFPGTSSPTCCLCFDPCRTCCACEPPAQLSYQVELVSCISEKDAWWTLGTALRRAFWATRHRELRKTVLCLYRIFLKAQRVLTSSVKHLPATFSRCPSLCSNSHVLLPVWCRLLNLGSLVFLSGPSSPANLLSQTEGPNMLQACALPASR